DRERDRALLQVNGDGRAGARLAAVGGVGARDHEPDPVSLLERVVLRQLLPLDSPVRAGRQRCGAAEREAVLHVDPAARDDLDGTVGGVGDDLAVAAVVGGGAVAPAVLLGEGGDALAAPPVEAGVVAEVDEQGGQVGGGPVEFDAQVGDRGAGQAQDRKSTRLNSSHVKISYAVFYLKK